MDTALIGLGVSLADVLSRNTVDYVGDKIRLAKEKKDLQSRSVASEDIEYLQKTLRGAVKILFAFSPQTDEVKLSIDTLIELLNKDTLKTMQLLGFNYREAIGQPLTEVCSQAIKEKLKVVPNIPKNKKR